MKHTVTYLLSITLGILILGGCGKGKAPAPVPTITSISPTSGPPNTTVIITGTNFKTTIADNTVEFTNGAATIIGATATTLTVLAPASGTTGHITVGTVDGSATGPVFTYTSAKPTITSISPTSGPPNTTVIITGTNFKPTVADNTVAFNNSAATIIGATATTLTVLAPISDTTGHITVGTVDGSATGPIFTYTSAKPTVTSISPTSGPPNTTVIITGTNFKPTIADNTVAFTNGAATIIGATATTLTVLAPISGTTGPITVGTVDGSATGPVFTYTTAKPTITSISPTSATPGASVTITGTNFNATAANNTVKFNATVATITKATATQLTVTVPAGSGAENVTVTTAGGISNAIAFTYAAVASGPDIYVLGSDTRYGYGYWKNSTFNYVAATNTAYAMVGIGSDIYFDGPATTNTPTYWKNGKAVQLSAQTGFTFSITKSGTDVYCLGYMNDGKYYVWKNGSPTALTTTSLASIGGSYAGSYINNAIAVNNGNVYVAGAQSLGQSNISKATYWKNGSPVDLTDGIKTGSAWATSVFVSGGDVYVAGVEEIRDPSSGGVVNRAPRLWKNGVQIAITAPIASLYNSISCILVVGSDVYIGGQYNGAGAVWKNGALINTASYAVAEQVSSMFIYNNTDLYFTGASSASGLNGYWKNGSFVEMDPGCQKLSSGCALTSANQVISIYVK